MNPEIRTPDDLRWSCHGCGACCTSGYALGPVEQEVVDRLTAADIGGKWAPAAAGFFETRPQSDGTSAHFLTVTDGHCVFLRDDKRCAVHDLLGASEKPGFCREFPYYLVDDPKGLVAVIRPTCRSFHHGFRDGTPVGPEIAAVAALPRVRPRRRFAPAVVAVLPGVQVPLQTWMAWEAELEGLLRRPEPVEAAVARIRARLTDLSGAEPVPVRSVQAAAALTAILRALEMIMRHTLTQSAGADKERLAFARDMVDRLVLAQQRSAAPLAPLTEDAVAWTHLLLRSYLLAKRFDAWGGVDAGLGEFLLAITVARLLASDSGSPVSAAALAEPLAEWRRFVAVELITMILRKARPALIDLFLHSTDSN